MGEWSRVAIASEVGESMGCLRIIRVRTAALLALAVAAGCGRQPPKAAPTKPAEVLVERPVRDTIGDFEDFTGRTEAEKTVEIRARVTGYLQKIRFEDGAEVAADAPLFEIDARPYQAALDRAEAMLVQAQARQKRLEIEFVRKRALLNRGAISREEFDLAADEFAEARGAVGVAQADRDVAALNLAFTQVTAPIAGRISRRMVDVGNMVKADETPLTSIVAIDRMYAYFDIDERTLLRLRALVREGKMKSRAEAEVPILAALADVEDFPLRGTIDFSENRLDPNTGTLQVRAIIQNPKPYVLSPGMFLRVRLPIGPPHDALMVAEQAVGSDQGRKFLYVVNDKDEVIYRPVKVGALSDDGRRVIEEGLRPDERVVVSGLQRIRPGVKVVPKPAAQIAAGAGTGGPAGGEALARRRDAPPTGG
jgi:multidrug efflux system membrane fusion protein